MIGSTLNQYKIVDSLGEGGMGQVYRARDAKLEREVAVKEIRTRNESDERPDDIVGRRDVRHG